MLEVAEALRWALERARPLAPREVDLADALDLILAQDCHSDVDSPPHDKAMMDGYAVRAADARPGAELRVVEQVLAGATPTRRVEAGEATRIMTGAPIPEGADAVVMLEQTTRRAAAQGEFVTLATAPRPGAHIMPRASSMRQGERVLRVGARLRPIEIGLLAETGHSRVRCLPRPRAAVLATGDELVPCHAAPAPGQIRNSNGPMLVAQVARAGATPAALGVARDDPAELRRLIARGLEHDALILSGGVSAGLADLVPKILAELGVNQVFHKVNLKPGKPLWFGQHAASGALVFGLPGNPVSSLVCFELFARPALARLAGRDDGALPTEVARLRHAYAHQAGRPTYYPARCERGSGGAEVTLPPWQGSGDLRTLAEANCLACFPGAQGEFPAGAEITVRWLT